MITIGTKGMALGKGKVFIDWTEVPLGITPTHDERREQLLAWVRQYPDRGSIRVRLRPGRIDEASRRLQRSLQGLGCTVIAKVR